MTAPGTTVRALQPMRSMTSILAHLLLLLFVPSAHASEMWLSVGQTRSLPVARGVPVRVASRGIIRVIDLGRAVRVVAMKPGATTLSAGDRTVRVRVTSERQHLFVRDLRQTLEALRGLTLEFDGDRPEITGTLLRFSDWALIADLARRHRGEYGFRAQTRREVAVAALAHLTHLARDRGYPLVRFTADPEVTAVLPASARSQVANVERTLAAYGVRVRLSEDDVRIQPLIRTRVVLAELTHGFESRFGIRWPSEYGGQILPRPSSDGQLLAALQALEARGHAQVLAAPDLSCRSGGRAHFQAGGEIPIRTSSRRDTNVTWKNFGLMVNVSPRADDRGAISLDLQTEMSSVDFAHAVDGVPTLRKNVVDTQFDLPGRRTVALAGLVRRDSGESDEGLPALSNIPLLGRLFSSRQYQRHRSELVIFVTPEVIEPTVDAAPTMPAGWTTDAD